MKRTYIYDPATKEMVEVTRQATTGSGDGWRFNDRHYSANPFKAADGTIIDSKRKHREYMKRTGLTTMDDFGSQWKRQSQEREGYYTGKADKSGRIEAIKQALEKHRHG